MLAKYESTPRLIWYFTCLIPCGRTGSGSWRLILFSTSSRNLCSRLSSGHMLAFDQPGKRLYRSAKSPLQYGSYGGIACQNGGKKWESCFKRRSFRCVPALMEEECQVAAFSAEPPGYQRWSLTSSGNKALFISPDRSSLFTKPLRLKPVH